MFNSHPYSVTTIQFTTTLLSMIGFGFFKIHTTDLIEILAGYFFFSCVGISIFYHRYYSHRSFETNKFFQWFGTICGVFAGRGSPIGWVAIHRLHHKHADEDNDPHPPSWRVFVPHLVNYKPNPFAIRDLVTNRYHIKIDQYYNLIVLLFILVLGLSDIHTLFFFWIVPVALTGWILNLFVFMNHLYGYRTFQTKDNSTNNWFISLVLWGEGWHNNHHNDVCHWNLHNKWWEIDLSGLIIGLIKK